MCKKAISKTCLMTVAILLIGACCGTSVQAAESTGGTWTQKASMTSKRFLAGSAVVDGKIYVVGGNPGNTSLITNIMEEYDPATDTWTRRADMPTARQGPRAAAVDGIVYAIGGNGGAFNDVVFGIVEAYDPTTDTWTTKTDMPTPGTNMAIATVDGKVYIIGGLWGTGTVGDTVEVYDPATDTWATKADMPTARWAPDACAVDGKIYVFGGARRWAAFPPFNITPVVEVYDPTTDTWAQASDMPRARFALSATTVGGKIYIIGGVDTAVHGAPSMGFREVDVYDPATDTWTTAPEHPAGAPYNAASVVDWKIYACGGWSGPGGTELSTVYEFAPTPVILKVPDESPGGPWYAGFSRDFIPVDGTQVAIVFLRDPTYIRGDFNLLDGEDIPAAFGCPFLLRGQEWWHEPFVDIPFKYQYTLEEGGSAPVYFVELGELNREIADDQLTIGELEAFSSLKVGQATYVKDDVLNSHAPDSDGKSHGTLTVTGKLEHGGHFYVHWEEEFDPAIDKNVLLEIAIKLFGGTIGGDANYDGEVNLLDLAIVAENWLVDISLAGYWTMDESSGSTAGDSSTYARNGALLNMDDGVWVEGKVGNAVVFDGVDDFVRVDGFKGILGGGSRTVCAWIRTSTLGVGDIVYWGDSGSSYAKWDFFARGDVDGKLGVGVRGGNVFGTTNVCDGAWHHVAAVLENDGTPDVAEVRLYVDGVEEAKAASKSAVVDTSAYSDVLIGSNGVSYFDGLIDEVRIYDRALSADEIAGLVD